jgi:preprotein translocase subunit SecG
MNVVLVVLHVIVCLFLIAVVLLQRGKGAEMGAVFGGGASSTVFGSRGAGNFLTKMTTASAAIFMITSFVLSYLATENTTDRLFEDGVIEQEAAAKEALFEDLGTVAPETDDEAAGVLSTEPAGEASSDGAATAEPTDAAATPDATATTASDEAAGGEAAAPE